MSLSSGNFFAVPVSDTDPEFEVQIEAKQDLRVISGKRSAPKAAEEPKVDELTALKNELKEGIDGLKQGGLGGVKALFLKIVKQVMGELTGEKEKKAAPEKAVVDPLDPEQAFALTTNDKVSYQLVYSLADKHKDLDYYEFRSDKSYGLLFPVADNVFKEIIFTYPSAEFADHHYPEQSVGHSVYDWRREDSKLHKMRVYFLSTDKALAEKYATEADLKKEEETLLAVDLTSTRAGESTRFSVPDLQIDARTGEVSLNFLHAWYLPTQTKAGRQIQYNWDALRMVIKQGDNVVKRKVCWSTNRGRNYIESVKTTFELMDAGYIGEIGAGQYTLEVSIYNDQVFSYPFEVVKVESTDTLSEPATYFVIKALSDDYAQVAFNQDTHQLDCYYPLKKLLKSHASAEGFTIALRMSKGGKAWPTWDWDTLEAAGGHDDVEVRNNPRWAESPMRLGLMFGNQADSKGRKPAPNGKYAIHIDVDGKEFDKIDFSFKDGEFVSDKSLPKIGLADVDFPKEHLGYLFPLQKD